MLLTTTSHFVKSYLLIYAGLRLGVLFYGKGIEVGFLEQGALENIWV
jgi:hypothetical protein